jgi:hypothetical protein
MVEVRQRHDQANVVQGDEVTERRDVAGVADPRHDRVAVGVVERRGERIHVGGDRRRTGAAECADDVDALPGTGEQDGRHARGGY